MTRLDLVHVPYKGAGSALVALLGGEVQAAFFSIPSTLPHEKRQIARDWRQRTPLEHAPELPTIAEAGVPL
jgi:tripartite-type tricarboxylate transporter receptor subunit TctC